MTMMICVVFVCGLVTGAIAHSIHSSWLDRQEEKHQQRIVQWIADRDNSKIVLPQWLQEACGSDSLTINK